MLAPWKRWMETPPMTDNLRRRVAELLGFEVYEMSEEEKRDLVDEQRNRPCYNFRAPGDFFQFAWPDPDSLWKMLPPWDIEPRNALKLLEAWRWSCQHQYGRYTVRMMIPQREARGGWSIYEAEADTFAEAAREAWCAWREAE